MAEEFLPTNTKNTTMFYFITAKLRHANGTEVTAQEAYDAFMNTRVLIVEDKTTHEAISMVWYDNNSAQTDPTNVGYVQLSYVLDSEGTVSISTIMVGNKSLRPK